MIPGKYLVADSTMRNVLPAKSAEAVICISIGQDPSDWSVTKAYIN